MMQGTLQDFFFQFLIENRLISLKSILRFGFAWYIQKISFLTEIFAKLFVKYTFFCLDGTLC